MPEPPKKRYSIEALEPARVRYEVLAESEDDARAMYHNGNVGPMLFDEHDGGEIGDVTEVGNA